jgi:hypothetical protein
MPFIKKAFKTLLEREGLSYRGFTNDFSDFAESLGNTRFAFSTIYQWSSGERVPTMKHLDLIYKYAKHKGHDDLKFYQPPSEE